MALKVPYVAVIMGAEIPNGVFAFGTSIDNSLGVMGEPGEMAPVFLGQQSLLVGAVASRVELEGVIRASSNQELAFVIKVERRDIGIGLGEFEQLNNVSSGI